MPCINNTNGQPVPGRMGSCPAGSRWVMSEQDQQLMQENEGGGLQNIGDWITPGAPLKAAKWGLGTLAGAPFLKGGYNTLKNKAKDPKNKKKLQNLKNKLFKRPDKSVTHPSWSSTYKGKPIFGPNTTTITKGGLDPWKLAGWGGVTGLTLTQLMEQMGNSEKGGTAVPDAATIAAEAKEKAETEKKAAEAKEKAAETKRRASLTNTQRIFEDMKKPGYWSKPMSDLPHDTRLNRLSMLMDYYGKDPVQRAAVDSPQQQWKATEEGKLERDTAFAKAQAELMNSGDAYEWSYANVNKALSEWYDDKFGTDFWFGKDKDKLKEKFMTDVTDEKARYPSKNLKQIAEALLNKYPDRYL